MEKEKRVLAFDFGASSGRAMLGSFDGESIKLEEVHRFSNDPVVINKTMYWDILRLMHEIKQGLIKAKVYDFESIGIDTWGVDFGLLDQKGYLLENPVHYRDTRTQGMLEESFKKISKERFYKITGNQFMELNTVFQLLSLVKERPELLERVDKMLLMPDLMNYMLTGNKATEYSIASTTQLLNANNRNWSDEVLESLEIPKNILTDIIKTGSKVGMLSEEIANELEIPRVEVIAVAEHDTQSAMIAVPAKEEDFIFLSCGTWSLLGTELTEPIINEKSNTYNITNEGGYGDKISFLKNIIGLWLIQESRRQWIREGKEYSFEELEKEASIAKPFKCFIDPDAPEFVAPGNIPKRIREFCHRTKQEIPETIGEIVRCIDESLALKYRIAFEEIKDCTNKDYENIYIIGGGNQSKLLCQMTANACKCNVISGSSEATVLGNVIIQFISRGIIKDIKIAREIISKSDEIKHYKNQDEKIWNEAYKRFKEILC